MRDLTLAPIRLGTSLGTVLGSIEFGGDEGIRTLDLCSAIAALSQLSYIPVPNAL